MQTSVRLALSLVALVATIIILDFSRDTYTSPFKLIDANTATAVTTTTTPLLVDEKKPSGYKSRALLRRSKAFSCVPGRTPERRVQFKPESLGSTFSEALETHRERFPRNSENLTRVRYKRMKLLPLPPQEMLAPYTFNNTIPVAKMLFLSTQANSLKFGKKFVAATQADIRERKWITYPDSGVIYKLVDDHPTVFRKRTAFIPGSEKPCFEIWLREYAKMRHITTLEYRPFEFDYPNAEVYGVEAYWALHPEKRPVYDIFWSYSNWEHDGLGRYGDPYNPNGDLDAIQESWTMLKHNKHVTVGDEGGSEGGSGAEELQVQFSDSYGVLGLPMRGNDTICWNAHRVYGYRRLIQMLVGFHVVAVYDSFPLGSSPTDPCLFDRHVKLLLRKICGPPAGLLDELFTSFRKALVKSEGTAESSVMEGFARAELNYREGTW